MKGLHLKSITEIEFGGKNVLVRGDFDVDDGFNPRADSIRDLVRYLQAGGVAKIKVIGHTETAFPLADELKKEFEGVDFESGLRKDPREKENNEQFALELADGWDVYVNEAFATSHRIHTSICALPQIMKKQGKEVCLGLRFTKEIEKLDQVWDKSGKRILVIGGTKVEDKSKFASEMKDRFAEILMGGLLPGVDLRGDKLDISDKAIEHYVDVIGKAEVILAAGVMGKYEDPNSDKGTKCVLEAIAANKSAYKVAGGGDIEAAIRKCGLTDKFDWISVGGGAMLVYLGTSTLPGLEVLA